MANVLTKTVKQLPSYYIWSL